MVADALREEAGDGLALEVLASPGEQPFGRAVEEVHMFTRVAGDHRVDGGIQPGAELLVGSGHVFPWGLVGPLPPPPRAPTTCLPRGIAFPLPTGSHQTQ